MIGRRLTRPYPKTIGNLASMNLDPESITVNHNPIAKRFEASLGDYIAIVTYRMRDEETIVFTHTGVPATMSGQGVGSKLARTALGYARENGLGVIATCPFMAAFIDRHPEYQDLLVPL
jgi:hypothetical protein